jgi:FkbM family methyltransferase
MLNSAIAWTQSMLSHSHGALRCAVKIQNQCRAVISRSHGTGTGDRDLNGEAMIIRHISDSLHYFVDVGANVGAWTQRALRAPEVRAGLLFEPSEEAAALLAHRFAESAKISIVRAAAGEAPQEVVFYEEPDAGETSSVVLGASNPRGRARSVQMTTVDKEVEQLGWPTVDYLKVDAEGYDFYVLKGARKLLAAKLVALGQFEYGDAWRLSGSTLTFAIRWLADLGYECFLLKGSGLYTPRPEEYGEYFGYSNYVFCNSDSKSLIGPLLRGRG